MASALQRKMRKDLAKLREIIASRREAQGVVVIWQRKDSDPSGIQREIDTAAGRHVIVVSFIGPDGGDELGMGPLDPENGDYEDDHE
ncbi:hypothetical protein MKK69_16405 [Methylobacterium sp. J-026]|uniref:hypothetical protein n=1 Tax=Methylobacterium sp. J-026 TaxID=2836624 RepID=UPI001FB9028C|nr:hypothetical protein [Methylobacterium sp. J-026]MCJ2135614.1 hypothetical protein [Methylobacterium sp. J-026]